MTSREAFFSNARNRKSRPRLTACTALPRCQMAKCETCGNEYDKAFKVVMNGSTHVFESFECAIHELAPVCDNCGCRVVGHGVGKQDAICCCGRCAQRVGTGG